MSFLLNPYRFGAAPATFPVVESVTGQAFASNATNFSVNLPVTVVAGDLLFLHLTALTTGTFTGPAGWTDIIAPSTINIFTGKVATGSEGGTSVSVTKSGTATTAASQIIRISNWSGNLADIESANSGSLSNTATFNPPNLAPSYGAGNTLWIAACWAQFQARTIAGYPEDTVNQNAQNDGSAGSRCEVACATRGLNASSWDPTAFTASGIQDFAAAYTFAIKAAA